MIITLLGGAGYMGAGIVRDLVSDRAIIDITRVRVCDTSREKMQALADELGDPRLELVDLDVATPEALQAAIAGSSICINCVPTLLGYQMRIFEAALAARVAYVDLGGLGTFTVKQMAEHARFKAAGVTAVIGAGADPGMSNVICRAVADELDEIDSIRLYWAAELVGDENSTRSIPSGSTGPPNWWATRTRSWCRPTASPPCSPNTPTRAPSSTAAATSPARR